MRIGFTIIYNGLHHLQYNAQKNADMLDYWVIIEGAANPNGSTSWCNELENKISTDGTIEFLDEFEYKNENVTVIYGNTFGWNSKDEMVNEAIRVISNATMGRRCEKVFLWEIDIDEVWTEKQMCEAEKELIKNCGNCGCFHANHFVGTNMVARGVWGEGNDPKDPLKNAYRRLWLWNGKKFKTHEPPTMEGGNGKEVLLRQRFNHYSYMNEKDVLFKSKYYQGYENLYSNWSKLQKETRFPQPLSKLIGGYWGNTETVIDLL